MIRSFRFLPLLLLLGASLNACGIVDPRVDEITLHVGPETAECTGMGPQTCLLVRESPDDPWGFFHGEIVGFAFEPGYHYTLRVRLEHLKNPPQDSSSVVYHLVRVVARTPAT
jgi:hypothetical protein